MGATTFHTWVEVTGNESADQAFRAAVDSARYKYGHGGYTGTIAEKDGFVVTGYARNRQQAHEMADPDAPEVEDKWGPAGCVVIRDGGRTAGYLFYGWVSE